MRDAEIADYLADALYRAADDLLFTATTPWELDAAMCDFGFSTGVCVLQDKAGLDIVLRRLETRGWTPTPILGRMLAEGRIGQAAGVGWYRYPGGGRVIDPLVEDLLREEAWFAGVPREDVSDQLLMERVLRGLRDAARSLQRHGVDAATIDRVSRDRLGFPAAQGGPLAFAKNTGLNGLHSDPDTADRQIG